MKIKLVAGAMAFALTAPALAHDPDAIRADAHAPIGVMGDHTHAKGEWMLSYRFMRMEMDGNRLGTDPIGPDTIATRIGNVNGPPAMLRVVPTSMTMNMHMLGVMYAPSDRVTLMAMLPWLENEMSHVTFAGMMGSDELGQFTARSSGFGDVKLSALVDIIDAGPTRLHIQAGLSLPTGSIDEAARVLTPMNTMPTLTLPYPMQLGSGTVDPIVGATLRHQTGHWSWGGQASAVFRIDDNDAGYRLGDEAQLTGWMGWSPAPAWAFFGRLEGRTRGTINGSDARIVAPVQTANPDFHGGERVTAALAANWVGQSGALRGQRFAAELASPLHEDLNGVQMSADWTLTLGWQYAWGGAH
ncbi:transporter family protein [Maricaulis maris]|uniref:Alpha-amylase n=1 Tax=Maricaulis maris TaxID=74318 RepID=A0A495D4F7_9PROT|nr:transporter [Maricaulis maris]RKQ96795.1 hypothetical protein C7435_2129 [Maricaulis maris]